jgi:hypothetical protein
MPDKNLILKRSLQKIVKSAIKKDPILSEVYRVDITFIFRSPVMSAMCDWVYEVKVNILTPTVNQLQISDIISKTIINTMAKISKDLFCLTDIKFESVY